jgi:putative ABC transport system permease protein
MRYALRALSASRGVATLAVLAFGLGIGANTAIFTIARALLFRSLPVRDPAHLVNVQVGNFMAWGYIEGNNTLSWPLWQALTERQDVLTDVFGYSERRFDVVLNAETKTVNAAFVVGPMFRTLGLEPIAGHMFDDSSDRPEVVISQALWTREFSSHQAAVGSTLTVEGKPFTIAGVLPARFFGMTVGRAVDVYVPVRDEPYLRGSDSVLADPTHYWLEVFGRLRSGITLEIARSRLEALAAVSMRATLPVTLPDRVRPEYLRQTFLAASAPGGVSDVRTNLDFPFRVLSVIGTLVLLLTCFTVANLLLARATARQRDLAVRVAIGAGRSEIVREALLETVVLVGIGTALGILVAPVSAAYLLHVYATSADPMFLDLTPDRGVFLFAAGAAAVCTGICGIAPAIRAARVLPADALKGLRATPTASVLRLRRLLLGAQIAASVVLVSAAVLFGSSLRNLLTVDRGFDPDGLVVAELNMRRTHLDGAARKVTGIQLLEHVQVLPGVESAALSYVTPISGMTWQFDAQADTASGPQSVHVFYNAVTPGFLATYRTRILAGRGFSAADVAGTNSVALVNATLARAAFGTMDVVGRRMRLRDPQPRTVEIVGVVQDAKYRGLRQTIPPTLYAPIAQNDTAPVFTSLTVRARGPAISVLRDLGTTLTRNYPAVSYRVTTMQDQIADSIARDRAFALLCVVFALLALVLGGIGIYGVLSYFVLLRRGEIAIRLALGASPAVVRRLIYRQSALTCAAGLGIGLLVSAWIGAFAKALLYGIVPGDLRAYGATTAIILAVAVAATALPAIRASTMQSMEALRGE